MQFMLILTSRRGAEFDESVYPEMGRFAGDLAAKGKIRGGSPLFPEGLSRGKPAVTDGPFTETKEVIGGSPPSRTVRTRSDAAPRYSSSPPPPIGVKRRTSTCCPT